MTNEMLQEPDMYADVKAQQEETAKEAIELQRLCYEVFHINPDGKKLYEHLRDAFIMQRLFSPEHAQAKELALYWEGFREAVRGFHFLGLAHAKRIAGVNG